MSDDETYEIPLQDQRAFGAGIKRKRVKFVPSSTPSTTPLSSNLGQSVSDLYLKLVLPGDQKTTPSLPSKSSNVTEDVSPSGSVQTSMCEICSLPLSEAAIPPSEALDTEQTTKQRPHEASLAHQVCLAHSHPPSHLDRNRKGLTYLSAYGWDPDSRRGLGTEGQGIQFPIKTKPKDDKMGIGVVLPKEADRRKKEKIQRLDAGKVRKQYEQDKKKAERLREMFYRNDDVERYLGGG
ncbi:hypothetical protein DL95DRAFT_384232 [Leptodontidium sp. 2 PMI_412]|nr:hypothetical protein BKA61DRAFT_585607 [Leptodontidium sp. MPI-SDFR-AT-0119]KAH9219619.1 hypothetical protein DL95DRAFT_384232 [Leptodontidium sp. 2 PMI_412]